MKHILVLSVLFLQSFSTFAQRDRFELDKPERKISNSLYNSISVIDSRLDSTQMGIIQMGPFNRKTNVKQATPIPSQISNVFYALIDGSAKNGEMLFQLRQLSFAELTGATTEEGFCYLRANLFAKNDAQYHLLASIDTVVYIKKVMADVTQDLLRRGGVVVTSFIAENMQKSAAIRPAYTYSEIVNIDSVEKRDILAYNVDTFKDGLYADYESFANQIPDEQVVVEMKKNRITSIKAPDKKGKLRAINTYGTFALVQNGQIWVRTEYGYSRVRKVNNDFLFTGRAQVTANTGDVILASAFLGIAGGLMAGGNASAVFEMKIDHLTGGFIRLKEVKAH